MSQHSYSAGGYDWLATWRRMYDDERNQAEDAVLPGFVAQPDCWAGQAERFATAAQRAPQLDGFMRFLLPKLRPSDGTWRIRVKYSEMVSRFAKITGAA